MIGECIKGLFLDDIRNPRSNRLGLKDICWDIVRSYDEFVSYITNCEVLPEIITFDHDLSDVHTKHVISRLGNEQLADYSDLDKTGYHAAKWLCEHCMDKGKELPYILTVHSANPCGADNIISVLRTCVRITEQNCKIYKTVW